MRRKKNLIKMIGMVLILILMIPIAVHFYMIQDTKSLIRLENSANDIEAVCILVLGAAVRPDGTPSLMLRDRLDKGIELYHQGVAPKLLLSGDNGQEHYDEVNVMKQYALEQGVPAEDIFLDHAGFSTYESIYRAQAIFQVKSMIIVTQEYHLYRALFISKGLGIRAIGISSAGNNYPGQGGRDLREAFAQNKDFLAAVFKPEPTYLGEVIPISGDGRQTHD